ncbi:MAG: hypothetical protein KDI13_03920 [Alphaproteobacteria bacterium]|nr:hypothetical protein [Alphaproteobacteria bacterium]
MKIDVQITTTSNIHFEGDITPEEFVELYRGLTNYVLETIASEQFQKAAPMVQQMQITGMQTMVQSFWEMAAKMPQALLGGSFSAVQAASEAKVPKTIGGQGVNPLLDTMLKMPALFAARSQSEEQEIPVEPTPPEPVDPMSREGIDATVRRMRGSYPRFGADLE